MNDELKTVSQLAYSYGVSVQAIYKRIRTIVADQSNSDGFKPTKYDGFKPIKPHILKDDRGQTVLDLDGQEILEQILATSGFKLIKPEVLNHSGQVLNQLNEVVNVESDGNEISIDKIRQVLHNEFISEAREIFDNSENTKNDLIDELKQTVDILNERLQKMDAQIEVKDKQIESLNRLVSQAQTITQTVQVKKLIPADNDDSERKSFLDRFRRWRKE